MLKKLFSGEYFAWKHFYWELVFDGHNCFWRILFWKNCHTIVRTTPDEQNIFYGTGQKRKTKRCLIMIIILPTAIKADDVNVAVTSTIIGGGSEEIKE